MDLRINSVLFILLLSICSCNSVNSEENVIENGVIDLRSWNFENNIELNGEWEFEFNHLHKNETNLNTQLITNVPGIWNNVRVGQTNLPGTGSGTYYLHIISNSVKTILSIKIFDISSSYNLFVDDVLIGSSGRVSVYPDSIMADYGPKIFSFNISNDTTEIRLFVANVIHHEGGIRAPILLGTQDSILRTHNISYASNMFVIGILFILFIYHMILFILRQKEIISLAFSFVCFCSFMRAIVTNERFFQVIFSDLDAKMGLQIEYLTMPCMCFSVSYYIFNLFPFDFNKKILYGVILSTIIQSLLIITLSPQLFTKGVIYIQINILLCGTYVIFVSIRSLINNRVYSSGLFFSLLICFFFVVNDILHANYIIRTAYVSHWSIVVIILTQAYMLTKRTTNAFNSVEQFSVDLEKQVAERTAALELSLVNLKSTQAQLIQSEKMASLGELTAGIAHEIQNPLNFVNNFSEVNNEMLHEATEEINRGNYAEVKNILVEIKGNSEKINHHGKRADAIVKGMLQHSRSSSGQKEPTDINALCDEYIRLAYHGLKAKEKSFNARFETHFDETIPKINVVPQEMGRVILNLINNAFYVVNEKSKQNIAGYEPTVEVSTRKEGNQVFITVKDNGTGIPQNILDKIFQPFFTTKPTGQGTGLGLSFSYDIIKANGGELKVQTKEGEGSEFVIQLPVV